MQVTRNVFKNGVPEKMTYPDSFIVPYSIGGIDLGCALSDLGSSINLMSLFILKKLEIEEVEFLFPIDFIILDYKADPEFPIILGRPFLSTGHALIDVHPGELTSD
ncbi:uncharacterized protein E5676_scaffold494G00450 [Cucumis melo var. makuwa]|uniref:Reverse transcriptase domain-containing protein n=1 Tax=Cucumis melo var. makuwa TaxID=1194695 RepID=A0A5D3DDW4_CUCMM|nr:uncharacterized protein E5676_scaffold494G00450 [Cucumis melo var. makuwa]